VKVSTRDFSTYRDPAVIFVDQLNKVHFDAELEVIESSIWHNRLTKKDYTVALNTSGVGIDDPDAVLKGAYACNSEANYTQYCTPLVDKLLAEQSQQADVDKRKAIVWEIERVLAEDVARPIIYPQPLRDLLARLPQRVRAAREQHLQQLALRGRLAGQVGGIADPASEPGAHLSARLPGSIRCSRPSFNISWCRRTRPTWPASASSRA